jgi:hypothetical protein
MLHKVLLDAGYKVDAPSSTTATPNVAAMLLIKLFQEGITNPADLSDQLTSRYGSHGGNRSSGQLAQTILPSYAIRGLSSPEHGGKRSTNWGRGEVERLAKISR